MHPFASMSYLYLPPHHSSIHPHSIKSILNHHLWNIHSFHPWYKFLVWLWIINFNSLVSSINMTYNHHTKHKSSFSIKRYSFGLQTFIVEPWNSRKLKISFLWHDGWSCFGKFGLPFGLNPITFSSFNLLRIFFEPNVLIESFLNFISRPKT